MAYHEALWVITGTAAPVFIVAVSITLQSLSERVYLKTRRDARDLVGFTAAYVADIVQGGVLIVAANSAAIETDAAPRALVLVAEGLSMILLFAASTYPGIAPTDPRRPRPYRRGLFGRRHYRKSPR